MEKIKNSFGGVIAGIVMIIIGTVLLWWNEGNNVKNIKSTNELEKVAIELKDTKVDSKNEGKAVLVAGKLEVIDEALKDEDFGVSVKTAKLSRYVDIYQWEETSDTDEDGKTTYHYEKKWVTNHINDSDKFHEITGHENPKSFRYPFLDYVAEKVKLGEFSLAKDQVEGMDAETQLSGENATLPEGYTYKDGYVTNMGETAEIGNARIYWKYNNWQEVTVLAVQKGDTFADFVSKEGRHINYVGEGTKTLAEVIENIRSGDKMMKWIFRAIGAALIIFGYMAILNPLSTLASFVPILGGIVGGILNLIAFAIGLAHSFIVIAIAWFRFRPILAACLLAGVVLLIVLIVTLIKKNKKEKAPKEAEAK